MNVASKNEHHLNKPLFIHGFACFTFGGYDKAVCNMVKKKTTQKRNFSELETDANMRKENCAFWQPEKWDQRCQKQSRRDPRLK